MFKRLCCLVALLSLGLSTLARAQVAPASAELPGRWPVEKAKSWGDAHPWFSGCNFIPSNAINQLEMFQAKTFDPATIDKELGYAQGLGFNMIRVFLHNLLWEQDREGFQKRLDQFLAIADRHHIGVMFVLFDSCWNPIANLGHQPAPMPFVHNSGWVQAPNYEYMSNPQRFDELEPYVKGIVGRFANDARVLVWDLFNEPDNYEATRYRVNVTGQDRIDRAIMLLNKAFTWARAVNPTQPLTSGVWRGTNWTPEGLTPIEKVMLYNSDVITFHNYAPPAEMKQAIERLRTYGRPLICSEYMARPAGSTFQEIMPLLHSERVGAINWGFVSGKTQTIYPWDSWTKDYTAEPPVWFHDIFRPDGKPYREEEVALIRAERAKEIKK